MAADPVALVADAIGRVAAGSSVDLDELRRRLGRLGVLAHPGLRSDDPPGLDGLDPSDAVAPLLVVLELLEHDGPEAAADRLATVT